MSYVYVIVFPEIKLSLCKEMELLGSLGKTRFEVDFTYMCICKSKHTNKRGTEERRRLQLFFFHKPFGTCSLEYVRMYTVIH